RGVRGAVPVGGRGRSHRARTGGARRGRRRARRPPGGRARRVRSARRPPSGTRRTGARAALVTSAHGRPGRGGGGRDGDGDGARRPPGAGGGCAPPAPVVNWDTTAALLWSLVALERFDDVAAALEPMVAQVGRSGSARGLVAVYSTLGVLKLRLGALPEADAAARIALRVIQDGDFAPGLAFAATVLSDIALE